MPLSSTWACFLMDFKVFRFSSRKVELTVVVNEPKLSEFRFFSPFNFISIFFFPIFFHPLIISIIERNRRNWKRKLFFRFQYDMKYSSHDSRPKNLVLKSVTTNVPSQELLLGSHYSSCSNTITTTAATTSIPATMAITSATTKPDQITTTAIDLDINVHAIKNMLMATRVPESCV